MIYFGFTWRLKREENINRNSGTNRDLHWVIEILGSSRLGINWLDFDWGRCGGMMEDFVIGEVSLFLLLKSCYLVPIGIFTRALGSLPRCKIKLYFNCWFQVSCSCIMTCGIACNKEEDGLVLLWCITFRLTDLTDTSWNIEPLYFRFWFGFLLLCFRFD